MDEYCDQVEIRVKQLYGLDDGGDLCWSLIESGEIRITDPIDRSTQELNVYAPYVTLK